LISNSYKIKTYRNILTKLVATVAQTDTVSCGITRTQYAPLLLLGKHRFDNLAWTRLSAAYPASDRVDSCSETDGRPECPFLWSYMHPLSMKFLCHFKMDLLVGAYTLNLCLKARCTVTTLFVLWNSSTHQPRCCEVSAILHFTALWRWARKLKISAVHVSAVNVSAVPYW